MRQITNLSTGFTSLLRAAKNIMPQQCCTCLFAKGHGYDASFSAFAHGERP